MRAILLLLFLAPFCAAQDLAELQHYVHDVTVRLTSAEGQYTMPKFEIEVSTKPEINASADRTAGKIEVNAALARAFYDSPGEMAFVIAHEIGHIQDADCPAREAKLNHGKNLALRECEKAADQIGMQYLIAARFSAYDAAGAIGRLMLSAPVGNSVLGTIIGRFTSDHPVSMDRINQLAEYAHQTCADRPEICQ